MTGATHGDRQAANVMGNDPGWAYYQAISGELTCASDGVRTC
jgi:hypothetical protein